MNMIKATFLALASAMLISNAASAQPPPGFEALMKRKYDILGKQAEGEYQRNIAEANKLRAEADSRAAAERAARDARYQGSFGTRYKYDLSRPSDQFRYQMDPGAQLRDQIQIDPRVDLDRSLGQYGGGVLPR
jgi:hypothetical protein